MSDFNVASIFGSGMLLQRDEPIKIWGKDGDDTEVTVFFGKEMRRCLPQNGRWECTFPALPGGTVSSITAAQGDTSIKLDDIVTGDVWIAGGQSNMEFFLRYEKHWGETRAAKLNNMIRMYTCPRQCFAGQEIFQSDVGKWFKEGDRQWEMFSAPGYLFCWYLQPELNIPIGIISCNWGGTSASAWLPEDKLREEPFAVYLRDYENAASQLPVDECKMRSADGWALQNENHKADWARVMYGLTREQQLARMVRCANNPVVPMGPYNKNRPGCLYENMVKPLIGLAVKGVIWYQGENDVHHAEMYSELFEKMIWAWRDVFKSDLPFLFVQLAPFGRWMALDGEKFPEIRRQQEIVSEKCPNCYMTTTGDIGDSIDIHPKEKREIGRRLALMAEEKVYGMDVHGMPPKLLRICREEDKRISLVFSNSYEGMQIHDGVINDLHITENGRKVNVCKCTTVRDTVLIDCDSLHEGEKLGVEFGQSASSKINVFNSSGIPALPFQK